MIIIITICKHLSQSTMHKILNKRFCTLVHVIGIIAFGNAHSLSDNSRNGDIMNFYLLFNITELIRTEKECDLRMSELKSSLYTRWTR